MKVCHIVIVVLTLQGGNTHRILKGTEGGNITVECSFTFSGSRKFFCKEECEGGPLVETTGDKAENGRYAIVFSNGFFSRPVLKVSITQLTRSDSGRYVCGLDRRLLRDSHDVFEISVEDAPNPLNPNGALRPSSSSVSSASSSSATPHSLSSSSGGFSSSSAPPETTTQYVQQLQRTAAAPALSEELQLFVGLILVVMISLLSLALLLFFCRRKTRKPKEPPVETDYASVSEANRVYEDIREDGQRRSSSVYTNANYTNPTGAETDVDYSFISAATSQHKAADHLTELSCSEVVLYSMLRGGASSEDASPPLYSALTLPEQ